jgi:signal transduction histidine kinase
MDRLGVTAAGAGLASIVADAVVLGSGRPYPQGTSLATTLGLAEPALLLVLAVLVVRRSRTGVVVMAGALTAFAVPLWLLRFGAPTWSEPSVGGYAAWGLLAAVAVAVGLYLRALDTGRARAAREARRAQRLELADDLHDFVVHDINEMLLQAQAGLVLVEGPETAVGDVLRRIERTAQRALTTVDRTVDVLHQRVDEAPRLPLPTMDDLPGLVERFTATGSIAAHLELTTPTALSPEVATTVYRIVVEALTNVRRHATAAGHVWVRVTPAGGCVRVEVTDDCAARTHAGSGRGGHGLAGLAARLDALGGTLNTGPAEPVGWRVTAVLPAHRRSEAAMP